ncbi:carboxypeptidase regulatory-like domain-containing protein, partial [Candidatus Woesearchaeota archaeon]|nr:carboxypeptidase regulatory-like domain-containing protein [Candidatus Woesearchaeota archaeon]
LIRLGSAYRRNPNLFQSNGIKEHILNYANYLQGLQGISVDKGGPNPVRLGYGMKIDNVFVPGPTNLTQLDVYIPGNPPIKLPGSPFPVVSLCGEKEDDDPEWDKCIADAALYYKCQIDEPCLDISYNDEKGTLSNGNGYAVSRGWNYEFGCFFDINLNEGSFNGQPNPCLVFYPKTSREHSEQALLAFLEAYPAVNSLSPGEGQAMLQRAVDTYSFLKSNLNFDEPLTQDYDPGFWGASLFLLYDYKEDINYLQEAYSARNSVSTQLLSDKTRGNEFYWEEYIRHKDAIAAAGLDYKLNGENPEEKFRGKMFKDYKDSGSNSISNNGERIYEFDHNILFQNSRYILTEGLLAAKATELAQNAEPWIPVIADMQLAWLTGMNNVQQGVALNAPTKSMSFIFGIGDFPTQFHSRYLIDSGYKVASQGSIIGARGADLQFLDSSDNKYYGLDGRSKILGYTLGALGNEWKNEAKVNPYNIGKTFKNGKNYISGWINGPFDTKAGNEDDILFNFDDDLNTYQFTESTDEIVATAIELIAYLDAQKNGKPGYDGKVFTLSNLPSLNLNISLGNNSNNSNDTGQQKGALAINSIAGADIFINLSSKGTTDSNGNFSISLEPGSYGLILTKEGYDMYSAEFSLSAGQNLVLDITMTQEGSAGNQNNSNISENSPAKITGSSTSLSPISGSGNNTKYYMREDATAIFRVSSNSSSTIKWLVNGIEANTTIGKNSTFSWHPGILFVPRAPD